MLLRGGRREAEAELAVVALELEGDGVEDGDEEAVVGMPDGSGISASADMMLRRRRSKQ